MLELTVTHTNVTTQPMCDFIIILHKNDMNKEKIRERDQVLLTYNGLKIHAVCISNSHKYSRNTKVVEGKTVALDQTYREALRLNLGNTVTISNRQHGKLYRFRNKMSTMLRERLNYQKAVMRSHSNPIFRESKIPMVSLCSEMTEMINVEYGDRVIIESPTKSIVVKCTSLSTQMQNHHDKNLKPFRDGDYIPQLSDTGKSIHLIFMDQISRAQLEISQGDPVKIRRHLAWEIKKKINGFGPLCIVGLSVIL